VPISHRWDARLRTLFVEVSGLVTEAELVDAARKLTADPSLPPGRRELVDLGGAEPSAITPPVLKRVAAIFTASDEKPAESRVAFYAPGDLFFGLSRMYEAYRSASGVQMRIFRDLREARAWLGIEGEGTEGG
jgi:hypothetical protein